MEQERTEWNLQVLDVVLNDPPITYTVQFFGFIESHMIQLTFELPTTISLRTMAAWAPNEIRARFWKFPRTHPIVIFAVENMNVVVHNPHSCSQCRLLNSPGGTRFSLKHSVGKVWLTVPRKFDFNNMKRNEDFCNVLLRNGGS